MIEATGDFSTPCGSISYHLGTFKWSKNEIYVEIRGEINEAEAKIGALSSQILLSHWSHSQSSNCLSKKNVANILKLAEKICHGWQSLCHTMVSKILTILRFRPIDSFDRHTF